MLPLAFGIVPKENQEPVIAKIKELKMSVGMVTLRWLLEAVGRADQGPHLLELYTNTNWDGWAKTIELGATTTWESWDALTSSQSMSHPWGTVGLLGIQKYILGVQPLKPQHEEVLIKPLEFSRKLTFANGTLPTDRGDMTISWERNDESFSMTITIPDNITARVYVPKCEMEEAVIKIDGIDTRSILEGNYVFAGNFGSGTHTFIRSVK
jgi:alpha-L-rhamnosidase